VVKKPKSRVAAKGSSSLIKHADVVIVGAGIVGQTLALALAKTDLSILIIDAQSELSVAVDKPHSPRVSAISAASQAQFEALGAWSQIARMQAYTHMQVWEQDGFGKIDFDHQDIGLQSLGHIIENDQIASALYNTAQEHENIEYVLGHKITQLNYLEGPNNGADTHSTQHYQIQLENNALITAKLLVGADGAQSYVRNTLGFKHSFWDYDHTAIVANIRTELPHELCARQVFTPTGPLAFLPLSETNKSDADGVGSKLCSIVWSQQTEQAQKLLAMDDAQFCQALAVAIDMQLGPCVLATERFNYPLRMRYARQWVDESVALVGDAAHTIHPLAGQGANLGIADAMALAQNIEHSLAAGKAFYAKPQLRRYERQRKAEAQKVIATMEGFKRLFEGDDPVKKLVRNIGLAGANKLNPVKQFFIQQAEGK
jgi:2-octaprenylphenol hydroxylase